MGQIQFPDESKALTTSTVEDCQVGISNNSTGSKPDEAMSLMAVIARAATDPSCDVEKMERLLALQEKVLAKQAESAFSHALAQCQPELPVIKRLGKGHEDRRYAKWEHINEIIKPILSRHGFELTFYTEPDPAGIAIIGVLTHQMGHARQCRLPIPIDNSGKKMPIQALGSSMSYGKRYTAGFLLNFTTADEDNDGGGKTHPDEVSKEEARGVFTRWKKLNPKGGKAEFENWVDKLCGLLRPDVPGNWRLRDLNKCHADLDATEAVLAQQAEAK